MSKLETWMTRRDAETVPGTFILEFPVVKASKGVGDRKVDALIVMNGSVGEASPKDKVEIDGKDVIVVQTKASRLGMSVMGQAVFSIELVKRHFKPKSVRAVIVCTGHDAELEALVLPHTDVEVWIAPDKPTGAQMANKG
ncbi:MAG: hypothetical protein IPO29_09815 [Anaerolineae bacterium]|nr:hypothetical protein [Anaerolineae bacterium]